MPLANRKLPLLAGLVLLVSLLALTGCGGGDGDDEDQSSSLTKAEYVKRADKICAETEKEQRKLLGKFQRENKDATAGARLTEEMITTAAIPPLERQAKKLSELPPPEKDAAKAKSYVEAVEKAIADTKKEPGTLLASPSSFAKAEDLSDQLGFKTCRGA